MSSSLNWALKQHLPSRSRVLNIEALQVITVGKDVTLIEMKNNFKSLGGLYIDYCLRDHENPHWLLEQARKYIENSNENKNGNENGNGNSNEDENMDRIQNLEEKRKFIHNEACSLVPSTILRNQFFSSCKYFSENVPSSSSVIRSAST